ncbi:MAG TPA: hypothetical protein VES42_06160 [Pilimelia sp.]|nr:hypothetical protein [Pilimelia sp.]
MVGSLTRPLVRTLIGGLLFAGALLGLLGAPLTAAPAAAAGPTSITITGEGLPAPLRVRVDADPELFAALNSQVGWVTNRAGQTQAPPAAQLGPKYTLVVHVKDDPKRTYDLYPLAQGGPRVFRPAKQPDNRRTSAGWFFGRLNMSETLRVAGVPLPAKPDPLNGGIGGGIGGSPEATAFTPVEDMFGIFAQWRRVLLLNGVVVLTIALGLAGFSLLIRRKI